MAALPVLLTATGCIYMQAARHPQVRDVIPIGATIVAEHPADFVESRHNIAIPGGIRIEAPSRRERCYAWEGFTHCERLSWLKIYTEERYALQGGFHFILKRYGDIDEGDFEEGFLDFPSHEAMMKWLSDRTYTQPAYDNRGLVVDFHKRQSCVPNAPDRLPFDDGECDPTGLDLRVKVYQLTVNGEAPNGIPGADDSRVRLSR